MLHRLETAQVWRHRAYVFHSGLIRPDRIMFGTDFPNLPYVWDREIKRLVRMSLAKELLDRLLYQNAVEFFRIDGVHT